jgi:RHS repeat-associated protein
MSTVAGGCAGATVTGLATNTCLVGAAALAFDGAGNLYIADWENSYIYEVNPSGILSIFAGNGSYWPPSSSHSPATQTAIGRPSGIAVDAAGDVYIADDQNCGVYEVDSSGGFSVIAGTPGECGPPTPGPATQSSLLGPGGLALDASGDLYIADGSWVEEVSPSGTLSIVAGSGESGPPTPGPATQSDLDEVTDVALDTAGNLYIADRWNHVVEQVTPTGELGIVAGTGQSGYPTPGPALLSELQTPGYVAVGPTGGLYIADGWSNLIVEVTGVSAGAPVPGVGPQEQGGGPNPSEKQVTACAADPVNCGSGELYESSTDLSVPGRGIALDFSRSYTSGFAATSGPLGYGWTDSYDMSLTTDSSGNITVNQEDGSTVTFSPNGSGGYTAPPRVLATLTQSSSGNDVFTRDQTHDTIVFSSAGQLVSETDLNGYTTTLTYNSNGQLAAVTDPEGRSLTFAYNSAGDVASVADPAGRTESFTYDGSDNLVTATNPAGGMWRFTYDPNHLLLTMTDPDGGTTTNTYNSSGQVVKQVDPMGRTTTWAYSGDNLSPAGGTTAMTSPNGNVTTFDYQNLEVQSETRGAGTPQAATTSYTYDPVTLGLASVTDPDGHATTATYNSQGDVLTQADPLGRTTMYTYNSLNQVTSVTDPSGVTTTYTYDADGNLLSTSRPLTSTSQAAAVSLSYGDAHPGDVTAITDADGNTWKMAYDADGDQVRVTDPDGDTTTSSYSSIGELLSQVSPDGNVAGAKPASFTATYAYNALGELISTTNPLGAASTTAYDADGNVGKTVDADGNVTAHSYDLDNELTATTEPNGTVEKTGYDQDGNVVSQTDGAGDVTTYTYDALDRVASTTDPLGHATTYSYDPDGNLLREVDPSGQTTTNGYDADNELTSIHYSDTTPSVSYSYDSLGQRTQMVDGTGTTTYSYDSLGRVTQVTDGAGSTVAYGYDLAGNLTALTYPNGKAVAQAYNAAEELTSVTDWLGNKITFSYDADGNLVAETDPSGVKQNSSYNDASQLTGIIDTLGSTSLAGFSYGRDPLGQQTSATTTGAVSGSEKYSYTSLNQLASANGQAYAYNSADDLVTTPTQTLSYNAGDELTKVTAGTGTTTLSYDANGDRTSETGSGTAAQNCALCLLDPSASGALTLSGAATVNAAGIVTVDSSSTQAIELSGSAKVTGTQVLVAGGVTKSGTASTSPTAVTGAAIAPDPLAALPAPALTGSATALSVSGSKSQTASPGIYSTITVSGSGTLTLNPGTYVVTGGVTVSGSGSITGSGVTLYLACSRYPTPCAAGTDGAAFSVTGSGVVHLTGGALGSGKGVAVFADRANAATLTVSGSGALTITGSLYAASGTLSLSGSTPVKVTDGVVVMDRAQVTGSAALSVAVDSSAVAAETYTYDAAQRLIGLQSPTTTASYAYDGDGLRMAETVDGVTSQFTWDQSGSLPLLLSDGTNDYVYGPGGMPIEQITGSTAVDLHQDGQGSTRLLTSSTGAIVGTYSYDPYGNVTSHTGASTPLEYDGQYTDAATGLQYLQARYYDPTTGQFLTVDPDVATTLSPYGYVDGDPVNASDPTGLLCLEFWDASKCSNPLTSPPNCTILDGSSCQPYVSVRSPDWSVYDVNGGEVGVGAFEIIVTGDSVFVSLGGGGGLGSLVNTYGGGGWIGSPFDPNAPSAADVDAFIGQWTYTVSAQIAVPAGGAIYSFSTGQWGTVFGLGGGLSASGIASYAWKIAARQPGTTAQDYACLAGAAVQGLGRS